MALPCPTGATQTEQATQRITCRGAPEKEQSRSAAALKAERRADLIWMGIVRPLGMRYAVFDERRFVMVAAIPVLLPKSESQEGD